jgi:ABC-2 type transport system permease protein
VKIRRHSVLKVIVVGVAGAGFWVGVFLTSLSGFGFVERYLGEMAGVLTEALLSLFFLFLGVMLAFSNAIISFGSLFRSKETEFLLSCPLREESVFTYRQVESLTFSSWAFLVLGFPLMLGYGVAVGAQGGPPVEGGALLFYELDPRWWGVVWGSIGGWLAAYWYYPLVVLAYFVPFVVIAASVGGLVALLLAAYLPDRVKRVLGASAAVGMVAVVGLALWLHGAVVSGSPFTGAWLRRVLGRMDFSRNLFLPSYWVSQGLVQCARGQMLETGYFFLVLASSAAVGVVVWWELSRRLMRASWSRCQSHMGSPRRAGGRRWPLVRWGPAVRLLAGKDWRLFVRDPVQWSQCAILFGLMGFYVLNLRTFSYHMARPLWRNLTALLNLAATSLVLATVATRFVFPLLSLEGRRFWVLGLVPVSRRTILWSKFLFSFVGALVVTQPLILVSDAMLDLPPATVWHHSLAAVCVCFGVSGLAVGLGAVYPNWREENPSKIVSGFGGTLNLLLSVAFVVVVVALTALPYGIRLARLGEGGPEVFYALGASAAVGLVAGLVPMWFGLRALERLEF